MFGQRRKQRKARAELETSGYMIQFIPGRFYHLRDGKLFTGVRQQPASGLVTRKLMPLAIRATNKPGEWVI